jgi:minor histocompatibility antigen H13
MLTEYPRPMMITVATTLEAPIKLVFPGPGRGSMLGLGDVVLPGIMMALALRFDLFLHYLRLPGQTSYRRTSNKLNRSPYIDAAGKWGDRFWTWGTKDGEPTVADGARFKKVYFKASLIGYVIGLITTLVVLNIFQHGQPALFYLVPSVLGSLWGTALVRGELMLMWGYTEDGSLDENDDDKKGEKGEKKDETKIIKGRSESSKETNSTDSSTDRRSLASTNTSVDETPAVAPKKADEHAQHVFLFSLTAPKQSLPKKALLFDKP